MSSLILNKNPLILINGPNLDILGNREINIYGTKTLNIIESEVQDIVIKHSYNLIAFQSNHEGEIIDFINSNLTSLGMIINPGALMIAGWSLRDTIENYKQPCIEVHISNIYAREKFRRESVISPVSTGSIVGFGTKVYSVAVKLLISLINKD